MLLTQGTLLKINQILLNMLRTRRPDDNRIAELLLHLAVVRHPPQRDLCEREVVFLRDGLDFSEGFEVWLVPITSGN